MRGPGPQARRAASIASVTAPRPVYKPVRTQFVPTSAAWAAASNPPASAACRGTCKKYVESQIPAVIAAPA